jgi:hypothetical protein
VLREVCSGLRPSSCYERGVIVIGTYNSSRERRIPLCIMHRFSMVLIFDKYDIRLSGGVVGVPVGGIHVAPAG